MPWRYRSVERQVDLRLRLGAGWAYGRDARHNPGCSQRPLAQRKTLYIRTFGGDGYTGFRGIEVHPTSVGAASASSFSHPDARHRALAREAGKRGATPTQRHVLHAIAMHANEHGTAWPSQTTIAELTGLSARAVRDALTGLRKLQLLNIEAAPTPHKSTVYRVVHTEQTKSGAENRPERHPVPVKVQGNNQEEIKTRAQTRASEPDRGVVTDQSIVGGCIPLQAVAAPGFSSQEPDPGARIDARVEARAKRGGTVLPGSVETPIAAPSAVPAPGSSTRAERSAANKAAWSAARSAATGRPRAVAPPARVRPKEHYQLPLPQGPLIRDLAPEVRAQWFEQVRALRSSC